MIQPLLFIYTFFFFIVYAPLRTETWILKKKGDHLVRLTVKVQRCSGDLQGELRWRPLLSLWQQIHLQLLWDVFSFRNSKENRRGFSPLTVRMELYWYVINIIIIILITYQLNIVFIPTWKCINNNNNKDTTYSSWWPQSCWPPPGCRCAASVWNLPSQTEPFQPGMHCTPGRHLWGTGHLQEADGIAATVRQEEDPPFTPTVNRRVWVLVMKSRKTTITSTRLNVKLCIKPDALLN